MPDIACFSCRALVPDVEGPVHRYIKSAPGCWWMYGEVLIREYGGLMDVHRLTVDAYAVQHPGDPSPQSIRSVALHLLTLCAVFERDLAPARATQFLQTAARRRPAFHWLKPPNFTGDHTVRQVWQADDADAHRAAVTAWARAAWNAWSPHHDQVRAWLDGHM